MLVDQVPPQPLEARLFQIDLKLALRFRGRFWQGSPGFDLEPSLTSCHQPSFENPDVTIPQPPKLLRRSFGLMSFAISPVDNRREVPVRCGRFESLPKGHLKHAVALGPGKMPRFKIVLQPDVQNLAIYQITMRPGMTELVNLHHFPHFLIHLWFLSKEFPDFTETRACAMQSFHTPQLNEDHRSTLLSSSARQKILVSGPLPPKLSLRYS